MFLCYKAASSFLIENIDNFSSTNLKMSQTQAPQQFPIPSFPKMTQMAIQRYAAFPPIRAMSFQQLHNAVFYGKQTAEENWTGADFSLFLPTSMAQTPLHTIPTLKPSPTPSSTSGFRSIKKTSFLLSEERTFGGSHTKLMTSNSPTQW